MSAVWENVLNIALASVLILCLLFTIVTAMKRLVDRPLWHKLWVIIANISAAAAIIGLVTGLHYTRTEPIVIALVTPNTNQQSIDQLSKQYIGNRLHWLELLAPVPNGEVASSQPAFAKNGSNSIASVGEIPLHYPQISQITVLGDGLTQQQWQLLMSQYSTTPSVKQNEPKVEKRMQVPFYVQHQGYSPRLGLVDVQWQKQIVVGQQITISGQLQTPYGADTSLYNLTLIDPMDAELDSQILSKNDSFSFTIAANVPGQWLYQLRLTERSQPALRVSENIGVNVVNGKALKVLIKQSSPSFETRHLQNMIAELGGQVLTLTKISKNKDIRQQINIDETQSVLIEEPFTAAALNFFDTLIIDQQALLNLTIDQYEQLEVAIRNGLGVLVQVQAQQIEKWPNESIIWLNDFKLKKTTGSNAEQALHYLRWQHQSLETPIASIDAHIAASNASVLVSNQKNEPLVLSQQYGLGRVAVSLINTSYIWKTQGRAELHSHYWQWLLTNITRANMRPRWQSASSPLPTLSGQFESQCIVNSQDVSLVQVVQAAQTIQLAMHKQLIDPNTSCIRYLPPLAGWYSLLAKAPNKDATAIALHANEPSSWQAWQQHHRYQATANIIAQQSLSSAQALSRKVSVSPYWFWGLLMISLTMLWLERKYFSE